MENTSASSYQLDVDQKIPRNKNHVRKQTGTDTRVAVQRTNGTNTNPIYEKNTL